MIGRAWPAQRREIGAVIGIVGGDSGAALAADIGDQLRAAGVQAWVGRDLGSRFWPQTEILVSAGVGCGAAEMAAAPRLHSLVSPVLGYDWFDVAEATLRGVAVVNGEVAENRESMAEATILLILALLYRLPEAQAVLARADGTRLRHGRMLKGKTLGVVGLGGISRALISRLAGWGCQILVHSRAGTPPPGAALAPLEALLAASDVVVVATSLNAETRHLLDGPRLRLMRPDALLVNTARGAIIDEAALVEVLQAGGIAGAALDVFEAEPLARDHPLRALPNVILTPHGIGHTLESAAAVPAQTVRNVLALAAGTLPSSCQNPGIGDGWRARAPA